MQKKGKIIVILGTTASGKTKLGVYLAAINNGEIVSADSRQVYKGMDIGTGKDLNEYKINANSRKIKVKKVEIPHHLIDVASPKQTFNLAKYQKLAYKAIDDIIKKKKIPIIVGGSGLYLQAIVDGYVLNDIKPDMQARKRLENLDIKNLYKKLHKINPVFAEKLNNSDRNNKRRLIRYMELASSPNRDKVKAEKNKPRYSCLILGLTKPKDELKKSISKRLNERLEKEKMIEEVNRLHYEGISWKKLESFGLEYKYISLYLQNKLAYGEMVKLLDRSINNFTKKQMTWFRRWEKNKKKINWVNNKMDVKKIVNEFLK
jgi:tRNA dimethylallyltransferase